MPLVSGATRVTGPPQRPGPAGPARLAGGRPGRWSPCALRSVLQPGADGGKRVSWPLGLVLRLGLAAHSGLASRLGRTAILGWRRAWGGRPILAVLHRAGLMVCSGRPPGQGVLTSS